MSSPTHDTVEMFIDATGGYPYFIQFICKEAFDIWLENRKRSVPMEELPAKLDDKILDRLFKNSHVNQMLAALQEKGLVYRNRHGKYLFAVPLFGQFIRRQVRQEEAVG
ncbi:MAG TPA: hypothetical protein VFL57_01710 [Bryobacteraceae bacterium]|nr:hypothetical protein [Bryobacteraceae bacterium]